MNMRLQRFPLLTYARSLVARAEDKVSNRCLFFKTPSCATFLLRGVVRCFAPDRLACYRSPEYQENIKRRTPYSTAQLVIVEGHDGSQP
jgi:uncharacterized protein DUF1330